MSADGVNRSIESVKNPITALQCLIPRREFAYGDLFAHPITDTISCNNEQNATLHGHVASSMLLIDSMVRTRYIMAFSALGALTFQMILLTRIN